jgi:hypothetical protein
MIPERPMPTAVLFPSELLIWAGVLALPALVIALVVQARAARRERGEDHDADPDPPDVLH